LISAKGLPAKVFGAKDLARKLKKFHFFFFAAPPPPKRRPSTQRGSSFLRLQRPIARKRTSLVRLVLFRLVWMARRLR